MIGSLLQILTQPNWKTLPITNDSENNKSGIITIIMLAMFTPGCFPTTEVLASLDFSHSPAFGSDNGGFLVHYVQEDYDNGKILKE